MSFTPAQQARYRPLVEQAWLEYCASTGTAPNSKQARDAWYRAELLSAGGWYTTKECDHVKDFDVCMLHFAVISGDDYWMDRISRSGERRMLHLINVQLKKLSDLDGQEYGWNYARSIYRHMGAGTLDLPEHMSDCPADLLQKVFQALNTHLRRRYKSGATRTASPSKNALKYADEVPF